jgi:serine/threonine protein kinase
MSSAEQAAKADKLIGEILANRYQIESRIGEGAMGTVFRARHVKVGRPFAVKVLHRKLLEDSKVAMRFEREAELAGRLRHPNVVGVVDVGETTDGLRYMVMDFAEGDDLATMLNEAPMKPERIINLTRQMLEGLYHAHEAGLIHRDFKPENVIVERDDHGVECPRIVDFGIAILAEGGDSSSATGRLTTNGLVLGTPHYMAPEQAVADPIDHRIDLFALGIVIYEMLSGKLPFDGNGAEVARANLLLDPPLISQRVPYLEVDPLLEAFSRRLMAKKRDMRPATAKVALELLDLIDKDRPAAAAALGVPLVVGTRLPQVTADVSPKRIVHEDSGNYDMPGASPRATDLEAPPVVVKKRGQSAIVTAPAEPLAWSGESEDEVPPRSKRGWLIGALAGAVLVVGAIVIATRGGSNQKREEAPKVTMQATPPAPPPVAETKPPVEEPKPPVEEPKPPVEETKPVVEETKPPVVEETKPPVVKTSKPPRGKQHVAKVETPKDPPKAEVKPPEPPKPARGEVTSSALVTQYATVGRELRALGDKASDLWPRYRLIQINDALTTQPKRTQASVILSQIQKAAAARK